MPSANDRLPVNSDDEDQQSEDWDGENDQPDQHHTNKFDKSAFQPGSIVRVSLTDFVTYARADFFPGPSLNMVIGPNGTGKSTFVSAICLGLGWSPSVLGRADKHEEFVARGKTRAFTEIELKGQSDQHPNHVVKLMIPAEGNHRKWWLNGKETSHAKVQQLMLSLSIQIDNLCQFLPQDKVSEFSAMDPKEKLHSTQRAAAPPQMLEWHDQLIGFRKQQKALQHDHDTNQASLQSFREKRDALQDDVNKLQDLAKARKQIDLYKKARPFLKYKARREEFERLKDDKKQAQLLLKKLQRRVEPIMQAINDKQAYQREMQDVQKERQALVKKAERSVGAVAVEIQHLDDKIKHIENSRDAERGSEAKKRKGITAQERKITDLIAQQQNVVEFDAPEWNRKIREEERSIRDLRAQESDLNDQVQADRAELGRMRNINTDVKKQLELLASQAGQRLNRLQQVSADAAKLYEWLQSHQEKFEQTVYGPPLLECRIKAGCEQYLDAVEAAIPQDIILSFVTQNQNDYLKLGDVMREGLGLSDVYIRTSRQPLATFKRPVDEETMRSFGLEGFSLDFVEGPDPVLAMLCSAAKLHQTGISLRGISEEQSRRISHQSSGISSFVAGETSYRISRRPEYGPDAVSTSAQNYRRAKWWNAHAVDTSAVQELNAKLADNTKEFLTVQEKGRESKDLLANVAKQIQEREEIKNKLSSDKADIQKAFNKYKNLPHQIELEEKILQQRKEDLKTAYDKIRFSLLEKTQLVLDKAALAFEYGEKFSHLQQCHENLVEAEIWLIEATSDFEVLTEENSEITVQVQEMETLVKRLMNEADNKKKAAREIHNECLDILETLEQGHPDRQFLDSMGEEGGMTEDQLEEKIKAEQVFVQINLTNNPNAQADYDKYSKTVSRLEAQLETSTAGLETLARKIDKVKQNWEPALDELVATISHAFSYNFEQIGCAGEVGVHKADDFDDWALEIKVKFREEESLQILDEHRQSGGERSVSTIFYLMALQGLAVAPFRFVDEINQGMDPRNERMVHERMVEIACEEHTSQYFLITPKLLPNLRYDARMRILCIASGEYMPRDHEMVSVKKALAIRRALIAAG